MTKNNFKYIIKTELKLNPGSVKQLLEDAKSADRVVRKHFESTNGGIKLPIGIDKEAGIKKITRQTRIIANTYNNSALREEIKFGIGISEASIASLDSKIKMVKSQLKNLDTNNKDIQVGTSIKLKEGESQKVQKRVGTIKATVNVGLRLNQNDLQVVRAQINNLQREVQSVNPVSGRPNVADNSHRDNTSGRFGVDNRAQSVGQRSTADTEHLNKKALSEANKNNASAGRQKASEKKMLLDAENKSLIIQKKKLDIIKSVNKEAIKERDIGYERMKVVEQLSRKEQQVQNERAKLMQKQRTKQKRYENLVSRANTRSFTDNLTPENRASVSKNLNSYRSQIAELRAQDNKLKNSPEIADLRAQEQKLEREIMGKLGPQYANRKPVYDKDLQNMRGMAYESADTNASNQVRDRIQQRQDEMIQAEKQAYKQKKYQDNLHDEKNNYSRYGAKNKAIKDDEKILRNPDVVSSEKTEALKRLKTNASGLAREMNQNLTRSFDIYNRNLDGTITKTRTAQYEFDKFGNSIDRSNRAMSTLRNTLQYGAISAGFYAIGAGVAVSVRHMAEFEAQLANISMISKDLRTGEIESKFSNYGNESNLRPNTRRNVGELAQKYGMSTTENVMPVYRDVMSRYALTEGKDGKSDPKMTQEITDQILKYSMITLGPGAQAQDIDNISQDMLSLYQGIFKEQGGGENGRGHIEEMDRMIDFMTTMNASGVNTSNIMDALSEIGPDMIKKGMDLRDIGGLLGSYNLSDSDATGSNLTAVAKTFFGGLARHNSSPSIQKGLDMLDIDTSGLNQQELFEEVVKNYALKNKGEQTSIAKELSSPSGKGLHQAPRVQKLLDSASTQYFQDFQDAKGDTGIADEAIKELLDTLKTQFGDLQESALGFVGIMSELGALDGIKALVGTFDSLIDTMNIALDTVAKTGEFWEQTFGVNLPKVVTGVLSIATAFKVATMAMNRFKIGTGMLAKGAQMSSTMTRGPIISGSNSSIATKRRQDSGGYIGGQGSGVGSTVGNIASWVIAGKMGDLLSPRSKMFGKENPGGRAGGNAVSNIISNFGKGLEKVLPHLLKFGGLLMRLSVLGGVITAISLVGKTIYDWNKSKQQEKASMQIKNFTSNFGNDLSTNDKKYDEFSNDFDEWLKLSREEAKNSANGNSSQPSISSSGYGVNTPTSTSTANSERLKELNEKFGDRFEYKKSQGYSYSEGGMSTSASIGVVLGEGKNTYKQNYDDGANNVGETIKQVVADRVPLTDLEKTEQAWELARTSAMEYESELFEISQMTEEFNNSMSRLGYDMSEIDFKFMGADNSATAMTSKIDLIKKSMVDMGSVIYGLNNKKEAFADNASDIAKDRDAYKTKMLKEGVLDKEQLQDITTNFKMAYENGDTEGIMNQYGISEGHLKTFKEELEAKFRKDEGIDEGNDLPDHLNKEVAKRVEEEETYNVAISKYLALMQSTEGFTQAEKEAKLETIAIEKEVQKLESTMKKLDAQILVTKSNFDVFNALSDELSIGVGKANTLLSLAEDDTPEKMKAQKDLMKATANEAGLYRKQLEGVQSQLSSIKASAPNEDFSLEYLYGNAEDGMSERQMAYKDLFEKQSGIHDKINSSTISLNDQRDALKDMIMSSDKYADVWDRVESRVQAVKDLNNQIHSNNIDMEMAGQLSTVRSAITGDPRGENRRNRLEQVRNSGLDGYEKMMTIMKEYQGDEEKLKQAYEEINKTMGSEFDNAFISPLKDLIANDFDQAGQKILDGATSLDQILSYYSNLASKSDNLSSDGSGSATSIDSGGRGIGDMNYGEKVSAYIEQVFGLDPSSKKGMSIRKQLEMSMSRGEIEKKVGGKISPQTQVFSEYEGTINSALKGRGRYDGAGDQFVKAGSKYGVDPRLLASIANAENSGDSKILNETNNVGNIKWSTGGRSDHWDGESKTYGTGKYRKYDTMYDGIADLARLIKKYINDGADTIPKINADYAEDNNWKNNVGALFAQMTGQSVNEVLGGSSVSSVGSSISTNGGASTSGNGILKKGSKGSEVKQLQKALGITADGDFGPNTERALKNYQKSNGLSADGIAGKNTWSSLGVSGSSGGGAYTEGANSETQRVANHYASGDWYLSSKHGEPRDGGKRQHKGVDISRPGDLDKGEPIYSFLGGTVKDAGYSEGGGNYINVGQSDGSVQKYMHMLESATLEVGEKVSAGQQIGKIGNTGRSFGDHLHYGMFDKDGGAIDPEPLLNQWKNGEGITNTNSGSISGIDGENPDVTPAILAKQAWEAIKQSMSAQIQLVDPMHMKKDYNNEQLMNRGIGNLRGPLGSQAIQSSFDTKQSTREDIFTKKFENTNQLAYLKQTRSRHVDNAKKAMKEGDTETHEANMGIVAEIDNLTIALKSANKELGEWDEKLEKSLNKDPRNNTQEASKYMQKGFKDLSEMTKGSVEYYKAVDELNSMDGQYMDTGTKLESVSSLWNSTGKEARQYQTLKRINAQEEIDLLLTKIGQIGRLMGEVSEGSQDWYTTLDDAVALQEELYAMDQKRLENAKRMFELTGQGKSAYINQKAYTQSRDYMQNSDNLNMTKRSLAKGSANGYELDANEQLATMQIIAGLHDQMIGQMNEYRNAVVGAFKASAISLDEYIEKMYNLRDVQAEARENAVGMIDNISSSFESSLTNALSGGMMGNMDSTQGFMDGIKESLAQTVSSQLSGTILNNSGLNDVMNGMISSITEASTSGDPEDIVNMFNDNNFGEQLENTMSPFLPLIEKIIASTDGIFSIMKDQIYNEPEGFKIDSALYDMSKGKSFEGVKNWDKEGRNESGSNVEGKKEKDNDSGDRITLPKKKKPTGPPKTVTKPRSPIKPPKPSKPSKPDTNNPFGMSASDFKEYKRNKQTYEYGVRSSQDHKMNNMLREKYNIESDEYNYKDLEKAGYYHSGGIAGMMNFANSERLKSNEVNAIMQLGEIALQPKQLSSLIGIGSSNSTSNSSSQNALNITVNVDGTNHDQQSIEGVIQTAVERAMSESNRNLRLSNLHSRGTSY